METIKVKDRRSFVEFVEALRKEFNENDSDWENKTLDNFLEGLGAYANDIQGYYNNTHQNIDADIPSWKVFADILSGAAIYE